LTKNKYFLQLDKEQIFLNNKTSKKINKLSK